MENIQDYFEEPIDDATGIEVDPSTGYESPPPTPQWEVPSEPPGEQDYNPTLESYTRDLLNEMGNQFRQTLAADRLQARLDSAESRAKEMHNGRDGLPSYEDLLEGYAKPLMQQNPDLRQLVLGQSDPAAAIYLIGFCARYPNLIPQVVARNGNIDAGIFRSTNFRSTVGQGSGRRQPSGKINYSDWDNESFLEELDRFKMEGE